MVERVLFGEEIFQRGVAGERGLVEEADVAPRAEGAEWAFLVHATHHHGQHHAIVFPGQQRLGDGAQHL